MTEKDLMQIRSLRKEERYLQERIGEIESKMYSLQSQDSSVDETLIKSRDELLDKLKKKQTQIYKVESWLEDVISGLSSEERMVIRLYYIKAVLDWDTVASVMQYSLSSIFKFRTTAIERISNIVVDWSNLEF